MADLNYAENTTGSFGSGKRPDPTAFKSSGNPTLDELRQSPQGLASPYLSASAQGSIAPVAPAARSIAGGMGNTTVVGAVPGAPATATPPPAAAPVAAAPAEDVGTPNAYADQNISRTAAPMAGVDQPVAPGRSTPQLITDTASTAAGGAQKIAGNIFEGLNKPVESSQNPLAPRGPDSDRFKTPIGSANAAPGASTEAGVSRSRAARIQQPTKANPVPVTPTSPEADIDETDNSVDRFGKLPSNLFSRKFGQAKTAFAGF